MTSPIRGMTIQDIYRTYSRQRTGSYPVGANNFWHGGIHIETDQPVVAVAPGKLIASRTTRKPLETTQGKKKYTYSNNFVLLEHDYVSPQENSLHFYSLYMHLLPVESYSKDRPRPVHLRRTPFTVRAGGPPAAGVNAAPGLQVRSAANPNAPVLRVVPQNARLYLQLVDSIWAMVLDPEHPSRATTEFVAYGGKVEELEAEPFVEQYDEVTKSQLTVEAGDLLGYPGSHMAPVGEASQAMIHFEIFADDSLRTMIASARPEGDETVSFRQAHALWKGTALSKPPERSVVVGGGAAARTRRLKISANSKLVISGDAAVDSRYVECAVSEMTRVVPLDALVQPPAGGIDFGIRPPRLLDVAEIFDGFPLRVNDHLQLRWRCKPDGTRVYPPAAPPQALLTLAITPERRVPIWVAKAALGNLQFRHRLITDEIADVYPADPDALAFDEKLEGLTMDEYFADKEGLHAKLDANNELWYEIAAPHQGNNTKTILMHLLQALGVAWTPREKGWIKASMGSPIKASSWPGFKIIEESGSQADDGFCDFANLSPEGQQIVREVDTSNDGVIDAREYARAVRDPSLSYKLVRCICRMPSEWQADESLGKWERLKDFIRDQADLDAVKEQIRKLIWWDDVARLVNGFPASPVVYHVHPLAFILHMSRLPYCVRQLQRNLRALGFELVGNADGVMGRSTQVALREFLIAAKMRNVARVQAGAPRLLQRGADVAAQQGENGDLSAYCASLERVANGRRFAGPLGSTMNREVAGLMHDWMDRRWRCPVVVEAWQVDAQNGNRLTLHRAESRALVNVWKHDDVRSFVVAGVAGRRIRLFARDHSAHYDVGAEHVDDPMYVLGRYAEFPGWGGPVNLPTRETWAEAEVVPLTTVGHPQLAGAERSSFKVVRAVSEVECLGFFDCITAYDNAFISTGPCHWTLGLANAGTVSEGELCAYLSYFAYKEPVAFARAFGAFGLSIVKKWDDGRGDGAELADAGQQRKYTGWIEQEDERGVYRPISRSVEEWHTFHGWHWVFRFQMAARTIESYRRRMWDMARLRLRDLRRSSWGVDGPWPAAVAGVPTRVTLGDVFTSERAMGMILRWHVRFPAHVIARNCAGRRLRSALARAMAFPVAGAPLAWDSLPSNWTSRHEELLIRGLREEVDGVNNDELGATVTRVQTWPTWSAVQNPNRYLLADPVDPLSDLRDSFELDDAGLPPVVD